MTTSSIITAPAQACPVWARCTDARETFSTLHQLTQGQFARPDECSRPNPLHDLDATGLLEDGLRLHAGPIFGHLRAWGSQSVGDLELSFDLVKDDHISGADELREIAANALAAAEWLEANR